MIDGKNHRNPIVAAGDWLSHHTKQVGAAVLAAVVLPASTGFYTASAAIALTTLIGGFSVVLFLDAYMSRHRFLIYPRFLGGGTLYTEVLLISLHLSDARAELFRHGRHAEWKQYRKTAEQAVWDAYQAWKANDSAALADISKASKDFYNAVLDASPQQSAATLRLLTWNVQQQNSAV